MDDQHFRIFRKWRIETRKNRGPRFNFVWREVRSNSPANLILDIKETSPLCKNLREKIRPDRTLWSLHQRMGISQRLFWVERPSPSAKLRKKGGTWTWRWIRNPTSGWRFWDVLNMNAADGRIDSALTGWWCSDRQPRLEMILFFNDATGAAEKLPVAELIFQLDDWLRCNPSIRNREVLMQAYANREAWNDLCGYTHYWSRSRKKLWRRRKFGNVQKINRILVTVPMPHLPSPTEGAGMPYGCGKLFFSRTAKDEMIWNLSSMKKLIC